MIPFVLNSLFNATAAVASSSSLLPSPSGAVLSDRSLSSGYKSDIGFQIWAWVDPANCGFGDDAGQDYPKQGDTCIDNYGPGTVAWSLDEYCMDLGTWLVHCDPSDGKWRHPENIFCRREFNSSGQTVFRIPLSTTAPTSTIESSASGFTNFDSRCFDPAPTGWTEGGGSLLICFASMTEDGKHAAAICNRAANDDDSPACATGGKVNEQASLNSRCPIS